MPTRFNEIGLAGKPESNQRSRGLKSDPYLKQYVIKLPAQTAAGNYNTGFTMPPNTLAVAGYIKAEAVLVGTAPTISVGRAGAVAALFAAANPAVGVNPTIQNVVLSGQEITFTIGGTVTTGRDFELVLTVLASDS